MRPKGEVQGCTESIPPSPPNMSALGMITRRDCLKYSALACAASTLQPGLLEALEDGNLITRAIPSSGEEVPIVGLGVSAVTKPTPGADMSR